MMKNGKHICILFLSAFFHPSLYASSFFENDIQKVEIHGFATQGYSQVLSTTESSDLGAMGKNAT